MNTKKIVAKIMLLLCAISVIALIIVIFSGCTASLDSASRKVNSYDIEIDYNSSLQTLTCSEEVVYTNRTETTLNYIAFHLYPNAFREESISSPVSLANEHKAYPNGLSYGNIEINSVGVNNKNAIYCSTIQVVQPICSDIKNYLKSNNLSECQYFIGGEDENILYIIFSNELFPDDSITLNISFNVKLPNIYHRFGYGDNTVNIANFYPIACVYNEGEFDVSLYNSNGDPFYSDMANYAVTLKTPKNFVVANTGNIKQQNTATIQELDKNSQSITTEKNIISIEAKAVRDFAIVLSSEFKVLSQNVDGTEVKYYFFSDNNSTLSLETSVKALQTFNEIIGKYPYDTLSVVEANFVHGGMEYPNLVYISNEVAEASYQEVIVHEIAHQWWYNLVGSSEFSYPWLDEGLTEYTTALFYELHPEYNVSKDTLISNAYNGYAIFIEVYGRVYGDVETSMNRALDEYETEQEYVYISYVKGMLLFDSLREIMGYDKFIQCLQDYYSKYAYQNVTPSNLIESFEKTTKTDLEPFFNAWIDGKIILLR